MSTSFHHTNLTLIQQNEVEDIVLNPNLIHILGDHLSPSHGALHDCDPTDTTILFAEVRHENEKVWSHKVRSTFFLSTMRHRALELAEAGWTVVYVSLDAGFSTFTDVYELLCISQHIDTLWVQEAGEYSVEHSLQSYANDHGLTLKWVEDDKFYTSRADFRKYADGKKQLRMEMFYRKQRHAFDILMDDPKTPHGGAWNFDKQNRGTFGRKGPDAIPPQKQFLPDDITKEVMALIDEQLPKSVGKHDHFDWPVTRQGSLEAMAYFMEHLLPQFGDFQDAMWHYQPYLYHSRLSQAMNVGLLSPKEVVDAALQRYHADEAPLAAVEGFVRQILGWREFIRGIYWTKMPEYKTLNALEAKEDLPDLYWDASKTEMNCLKQVVGQTLDYGYAHHIQRLMITGLFCLIYGVDPIQVHEWYLAVYIDAVEWVELPNTLAMSQFHDGGYLASKPYIASGNYINKMSNYCTDCRYDYRESVGDNACPFSTFYWSFMARHEERLRKNPRMNLQMRNWHNKSDEAKAAILKQDALYRDKVAQSRL